MQIHVLPGDSLVEMFAKSKIEGEVIICRECLVDGDLRADSLDEFWETRRSYLGETYSEVPISYNDYVKGEFDKLIALPNGTVINLWFEYELFCQVNMWFCLWLLREKDVEIYRVAPIFEKKEDIWKGFGALNKLELEKSFEKRKRFTADDIDLGIELWKSFSNGENFEKLKSRIEKESECFPNLQEVCEAANEIHTRPKEAVRKLIESGEQEFGNVFRKFMEKQGVYGFGDLQVKRIYDELIK